VTTTSARSDAAAAGVDPSGSSFIHLSLDGCQIGEIYIYMIVLDRIDDGIAAV
jgi:hypothetical protein